jgi:hypothetical protein
LRRTAAAGPKTTAQICKSPGIDNGRANQRREKARRLSIKILTLDSRQIAAHRLL